jgi:hypothetical protein
MWKSRGTLTRISNSFDPGDRHASTTTSNRRRTTKYASDHSTRDLQRRESPTLPTRHLSTAPDAGDRVFEPYAVGTAR